MATTRTDQLGFDPQDFPSLELAYEALQDVLNQQAQAGDALDSKATTMWSVATGIIGIVVPLVLPEARGLEMNALAVAWLSAAITAYAMATVMMALATFPQRLGGILDPGQVKAEYAALLPERFKVDMVSHIEQRYRENARRLDRKAGFTRGLFTAVLLETLWLLAWASLLYL